VSWWAGPVAAVATGAGLVWWLRHRYLIVTVHGRSMLPTYADGDRVLVRRRRSGRRARVGDVVVVDLSYRLWPGLGAGRAAPPGQPMSGRVVKRVAAGPGDPVPAGIAALDARVPAGSLVLLGDNPAESTDSRQYGYVPADRVIGVVLRHLG
jgi:signal peptidase I